ncbi:MAG TPA: NAD-dependent epimerase/dehydratase family protein [Noviherbaspirillum sp.]|uniref:NAD-dependent epimerase/dehydratase family protein n=1 Tax=Noviherbaspirillum sp. TaxID=1926288 RepID=UPI002D50BBFD|nr:NAD-dependent epimerase/dehydratase family protein [Noviherbaspirillum sp.]HYD94542.1 NAD-dependent epimerase/dehydratase family protein [Noviherbaspirillum sp.]
MRVLVTGANGHLGYMLVKNLVEAGHAVRASVRSLADARKTSRLEAFSDVEIVEAQLARWDQMRAAMDDREVVFHAAAVYAYTEPERDREMIEASVQGAETAVRCAADAGVRKLVLTSSMVTVPLTAPGAPPIDETAWTDDLRVPYIRAKTEGERNAWRVARECGLHMVAVLPGAILGPGFVRNTPSIDVVEMMARGALRMGVPDMNFPLVDVRDVVHAHLLAAEKECEGRFIVCNDALPSLREMVETLHEIDPSIPLPMMTLPDFMIRFLPAFDRLNHLMLHSPLTASPEFMQMTRGKRWNASNRRIKEVLGWEQTISMYTSIADTLGVLRQRQGAAAGRKMTQNA